MAQSANNVQPVIFQKNKAQKTHSGQFASRESNEIILGFSGPLGCGISTVIDRTTTLLKKLQYEVVHIKLSEFIQARLDEKSLEVDIPRKAETSKGKRYEILQSAGNQLRKDTAEDVLAQYAITQVAKDRVKRAQAEKNERDEKKSDLLPEDLEKYTPKKVAYIIDQLKHPNEVLLLRTVYRKLFYLVGVFSLNEKRKTRLFDGGIQNEADISFLMERDRRESDSAGQQLEKTLKLADFFFRNDKPTSDAIDKALSRFLKLIHGQTDISPTRHEYAMYIAYAASGRSACLSRQVGAAVCDSHGTVLATGTNDVPKAGGGLYGPEDDTSDERCVKKQEAICYNELHRRKVKEEIQEEAGKYFRRENLEVSDEAVAKLAEHLYRNSRISSLIEFSRSVHAEMDALLSVVRNGKGSVVGGTLYTTTFPCHSCARHIVAAGISRVVYIEPYEKSLAKELHSDSIAFDADDRDTVGQQGNGKPSSVHFVHFEGVAPAKYLSFFVVQTERKTDNGKAIQMDAASRRKIIPEYLDPYTDFEAKVVDHFDALVSQSAKSA